MIWKSLDIYSGKREKYWEKTIFFFLVKWIQVMEISRKLHFQTLKRCKYKTLTFRDHIDILCSLQFLKCSVFGLESVLNLPSSDLQKHFKTTVFVFQTHFSLWCVSSSELNRGRRAVSRLESLRKSLWESLCVCASVWANPAESL